MTKYDGVRTRNERGHQCGHGYRLAWRGDKIDLVASKLIVDTNFHYATDHPSGEVLNCAAGSIITVDFEITFSGTPSTIEIVALFRDQGESNWKQYRSGEWVSMAYSQEEIDDKTGDVLREMVTIPAIADDFSLGFIATGADADNSFTVSAQARVWRK